VTGLACPACAGALEVAEGQRVIACPYCGQPLLAVSELGTGRFAVEPEVGADAARASVRRWLAAGWSKDPALDREAVVGEALLCFLPFFRVRVDCLGIALGTERRRRTVGSGKSRRTQTYEVDVERRAEKSFDRTFPAVNVAEWGVSKVSLAGDRLIPFAAGALERRGMVFPPTGSEAAVLEAARRDFQAEADPARGLERVRFRYLTLLRERLTLVYYPLWIVRYRFRGRSYQVVVDAEDGSLAYGKAPGNDLYRAVMLVSAEAAAFFLATTALQWALAGGGDRGELVLGAGAVALAILAWGWRKFRYGGVVEEGSGVAPPGRGFLAGLLRFTAAGRNRGRPGR
jgi:uncharacterized protein YbaR (Trm112 family)